jgi:hypothetical protein
MSSSKNEVITGVGRNHVQVQVRELNSERRCQCKQHDAIKYYAGAITKAFDMLNGSLAALTAELPALACFACTRLGTWYHGLTGAYRAHNSNDSKPLANKIFPSPFTLNADYYHLGEVDKIYLSLPTL